MQRTGGCRPPLLGASFVRPVLCQDAGRALRGGFGERVGAGGLFEVLEWVEQKGDGAVDRDEVADGEGAVEGEPDAVPDHRDEQQARQQYLDGRDQRPHPGVADGGLAYLLGGAAVAAEEELFAADTAQDAQPGDGVGGQLGGLVGLLALGVGAPGRGRQQWQDGQRDEGYRDGYQDAQFRLVEGQGEGDAHHGQRRSGEPGEDFDE